MFLFISFARPHQSLPSLRESIEISRLTMTGDQGTLDSSLTGGYLTKASNYGPGIFKAFELVSLNFIRDRLKKSLLLLLIKLKFNHHQPHENIKIVCLITCGDLRWKL